MNLQTTTRDMAHARACEDAVKATLRFAGDKAHNLGYRPSEVAAAVCGKTTEWQARKLLIGALALSHGVDGIDAAEEFVRLIEDTADDMARECREYARGEMA